LTVPQERADGENRRRFSVLSVCELDDVRRVEEAAPARILVKIISLLVAREEVSASTGRIFAILKQAHASILEMAGKARKFMGATSGLGIALRKIALPFAVERFSGG